MKSEIVQAGLALVGMVAILVWVGSDVASAWMVVKILFVKLFNWIVLYFI